jgi:AraC family transcriptional regulator of adaptative response/methylated-DNA-[protein]-cysteine methyltransferase
MTAISTTQELRMQGKMTEHICYAWGASSLGDFIAAVSDEGLVAFEFGAQGAVMLDSLQDR